MYVQLTKEAYDDVIKAAGIRASSVVSVIERHNGFVSNEDAPPDADVETEVSAEERESLMNVPVPEGEGNMVGDKPA